MLENARLENGSLFMVNGAYVSDSLLVRKCVAHITNTNATSFRIHSLASYYYYNTMYRTRIHDKKITFATNVHGNWENCPESLLQYWPGVQKIFQEFCEECFSIKTQKYSIFQKKNKLSLICSRLVFPRFRFCKFNFTFVEKTSREFLNLPLLKGI